MTKNLPLLDSQRSTAERARQRRSTTAMSSLVDLPEHVALRVLSRLDSCDLRALGATCRAFRERMHHEGLSLVEAGAAEAVAARYPWLGSPREKETWLSLLRFAEHAERVGLPSLTAAQDTTVIVDARGAVHVWGPVVDGESSEPTERDVEATTELTKLGELWPVCTGRALTAAAGRCFNVAAGVGSSPLTVLRNKDGIEMEFAWYNRGGDGDSPGSAGRPPLSRTSFPERFDTPGLVRLMTAPRRGAFGGQRVVSVAVGSLHAIAATESGRVYTWGGDAKGQLGHGSIRDSVALSRLSLGGSPGGSSPGGRLRRDRRRSESPRGGGSPRSGSPAIGAAAAADEREQWSKPREVSELFGHRVVGVAASGDTSAAFTASGSMYTWGCGRFGKLGLGDCMNRDVPTRVALVPIHQSSSTVSGSVSVPSTPQSRSVSPFVFPGAMSDTDDEDDGAGSDSSSDDSDGSPASDPNYGKVVGVWFGAAHGLAITARGDLWTWGDDSGDQLGRFREGDERTWRQRACHPGRVQVDWHLLDPSVVADGYFDTPVADPPDIKFVSAAGGQSHSVACDSEGRVWIAGTGDGAGDPRMLYQNDGGDPAIHREGMSLMRTGRMWESIDSRLAPAGEEKYPKVVSVAAGNNHTVLMTDSGDIWCWGDPTLGQLGPAPVARIGPDDDPIQFDLLDEVGVTIPLAPLARACFDRPFDSNCRASTSCWNYKQCLFG